MTIRELVHQLEGLNQNMELFMESSDDGEVRSEIDVILHHMVKNGLVDSVILVGVKGTEIYIEEDDEEGEAE